MDMKRLKEIAGQAGQQNGCRLYDFYRHRDRLQFLIDKPGNDVSLADCENVFHSLQFLIRSEFPEVLEQKRLEVSSPGLEKQLREIWHFREVLGQTIKVITSTPIKSVLSEEGSGRNRSSQSITADLTDVASDGIVLQQGYLKWNIPFSKIKTAQAVFLLSKKTKQVKKKTKKIKKKVSKQNKKQKR